MASVTEFRNEITAALQAHVPIVIVESYEWERVEGMLCGITRKEGITYLKATAERGLRLFDTDKKRFTSDDPLIADQHDWSIDNIVRWVRDELEGDVLLHIEDFHHNFQGEELAPGNHLDAGTQPHTASWAYVGYWRELARMKPARGKTVLISGATQMAFGDLEKEVVSIKLDLPEVKELRAIYDRVLRQQGFDSCDDEERDRVVEAARGLTVMEAQTAFALAGLNNDRKA